MLEELLSAIDKEIQSIEDLNRSLHEDIIVHMNNDYIRNLKILKVKVKKGQRCGTTIFDLARLVTSSRI